MTIIPYKSKYTFKEVWEELIKTSGYKKYILDNDIESKKLAEIAEKKIKNEAYFLPIGISNTHMGNVIVMLINTLSQPLS